MAERIRVSGLYPSTRLTRLQTDLWRALNAVYLKEGRLVRATPWSGVLDAAKTLARERLITMKAQGAATVAEVTDAAGKVVCSITGDDADRT